ncbi:MAG: CocE/NonD family hydrolase [Pseudomonadota bacterium]
MTGKNARASDTREPRRAVEVTEHLWIAMPDGTRLAARLWLPDGATQEPVPALFEYIPYRKADMVRARDARTHPFFAAHGFACLRVDMRGSGDSEGTMTDMYSAAELQDARDVIAWIAAQPWCSGAVGMFGTSWGGTAALQANLDAPEALKAVIAVCATHDRFEDDIHYMGGALLTDTLEWGATLPAILAAPPTPDVGPDWKTRWQRRVAGLGYPVETWLREGARGAYWRHGSVIHAAARLTRPILAIGGWSDRYSNSVMSLVSARPDLVWGLVGPWGHHYPDHGHPGPAMGFQALALDWWRHWLCPAPPPPDWPRLRIWLCGFDPPEDRLEERSGRWIEADGVASATEAHRLELGGVKLATAAADWRVATRLEVGRAAGDTGYFGRPGGLPLDQAIDDKSSLVFETPPHEAEQVLFGASELALRLTSLDRNAQIVARLCDVGPDGRTALIARTIRNLALDDRLDAPRVPLPRERHLALLFPTTAYAIAPGHRLRLALSLSYWPLLWPTPHATRIRLNGGALTLPLLRGTPRSLSATLPPVEDLPRKPAFQRCDQGSLTRQAQIDASGTHHTRWHQPMTAVHHRDIDTTFAHETRATFQLGVHDPLSAMATFAHHARYARPDGTARIESVLKAHCDAAHFYLTGSLDVRWDAERIGERRWEAKIPRRFG